MVQQQAEAQFMQMHQQAPRGVSISREEIRRTVADEPVNTEPLDGDAAAAVAEPDRLDGVAAAALLEAGRKLGALESALAERDATIADLERQLREARAEVAVERKARLAAEENETAQIFAAVGESHALVVAASPNEDDAAAAATVALQPQAQSRDTASPSCDNCSTTLHRLNGWYRLLLARGAGQTEWNLCAQCFEQLPTDAEVDALERRDKAAGKERWQRSERWRSRL